ncbi:MAG: hypothetical protein Q9M15_01815, partial [Mariprofundaceae bacterium]|nr:hypothetical protein [Mariprofundaceae bacterium]
MPNSTVQNPKQTNPFQPFGDGVRIGVVAYAEGDQALAANLADLCALHRVNYATATHLEYPNGSIAMLNPKSHGVAGDLYLSESAYGVFM